jgi:hypothetical protein
MQHIPPKRRLNFNVLHGVISQETYLFMKYYCSLKEGDLLKSENCLGK